MKMQEFNGTDVGNINKSDKASAEIIEHVAHEMRCKFVDNVKKTEPLLNIAVHSHPCMIIYVHCDVTGESDVDNVLLDMA